MFRSEDDYVAYGKYREHMARYSNMTWTLSMVKTDHPDMLALVNLGVIIIPFILRDISKATNHEFYDFNIHAGFHLLWTLTGDNAPVIPDRDRGRIAKIQKICIKWGKDNGLLLI